MSNASESSRDARYEQDFRQLTLSQKRRVGRPGRSSSGAGRDLIVARMQQFMREKPFADFQRKEIAEYSDVTPALISYYFSEKHDLVFEASSSVISKYVGDVDIILHSNMHIDAKLKKLIESYIALGLQSGYTIDYYVFVLERRNRFTERANLDNHHRGIISLMAEILDYNGNITLTPEFVHSSLWSQCIYISRGSHISSGEQMSDGAKMLEKLSSNVYTLFMGGLTQNLSHKSMGGCQSGAASGENRRIAFNR